MFIKYDVDQSNSLDIKEGHNFFNDLYAAMHDPRRFTQQEVAQLFSMIDVRRNGTINKDELFVLVLQLWEGPNLHKDHNNRAIDPVQVK